jgi:hypothetical protein
MELFLGVTHFFWMLVVMCLLNKKNVGLLFIFIKKVVFSYFPFLHSWAEAFLA